MLLDGASLIYTSQNTPSQLPLLIHSTLGITSLLKRQPLKHNVIDRDKIVVAPNWDSWGKIRILGGNFDAEAVSKGWEEDIKLPPGSNPGSSSPDNASPSDEGHSPTKDPSAISQYEEWCRDPNSGGLAVVESAMSDGQIVSVDSENPQEFFERQVKILEAFKAKLPEKGGSSPLPNSRRIDFPEEKSVNDHIGPVQFNMGGIQVDADDMLQRLKVCFHLLPFFFPCQILHMANKRRTGMHTPLQTGRKTTKTKSYQWVIWPRILTMSSCRVSLVVL